MSINNLGDQIIYSVWVFFNRIIFLGKKTVLLT